MVMTGMNISEEYKNYHEKMMAKYGLKENPSKSHIDSEKPIYKALNLDGKEVDCTLVTADDLKAWDANNYFSWLNERPDIGDFVYVERNGFETGGVTVKFEDLHRVVESDKAREFRLSLTEVDKELD